MPYLPIAPQAAAVLAEFANQLDIPQVSFDGGGHAKFLVDEDLALLLAADAHGLTLSADLGPLTAGSPLEHRALEANYWRHAADEAWLGLEPDRRHLHLFLWLPAGGLDYLLFETKLRGFLEDCATWRATLRAPAAAAGSSLSADPHSHILGFDRA